MLGRVAVAVRTAAQAGEVRDHLRAVLTYGAVGPVGAHPIDRSAEPAPTRTVDATPGNSLQESLADLHTTAAEVVVLIADDEVHDLDLGSVAGTVGELGGPTLRLAHSLTIRAADATRPIVRLAGPLRARALDAGTADAIELRLEGLRIAPGPGFAAGDPLIARADLGALVLEGCTLDPGGSLGACAAAGRSAIQPAIRLRDAESPVMASETEVHVRRSVTGPLRIDRGYRLFLTDSIIDAGSGVNEDPATAGYALSGASGPPAAVWGPQLQLSAVTVFGRVRVQRASGSGAIWTQPSRGPRQPDGLHQEQLVQRPRRSAAPDARVRTRVGKRSRPLRFVSEVFSAVRSTASWRWTATSASASAGPRTTRWGRSGSCSRRTSGTTSRSVTGSSCRWGSAPCWFRSPEGAIMHGDFSRSGFDNQANVDGVLQQQGRVFTDADWNEQTWLGDRWHREAARAAIGDGMAAVSAADPDALLVVRAGVANGEITVDVNPGQVWAGGLLAYLRASTADATAVERRVATYLGDPDGAAPGTAGTRDAVVLDSGATRSTAFRCRNG